MHDLSKGSILVTGGAGFIGSAIIWALNQRGLENIIVSDFLGEDERFKNLIPLKYTDYIEADDLMEEVLSRSPRLSDIKTIFHLGACSATTETDCRYLIHNNYEYTKDLAAWALEQDIRFVYASSAATYGEGEHGMDDKLADLSVLRPLNMYGYSKHMFDMYAKRRGFLSKIVGLKYYNVFGPNEHHKEDMRSVVHKAYHQILEGGQVKLFKSYRPDYKDGEQMRDFVYVKDAVDMTLHLAECSQAGGIYNIGSGEANTWLLLVRAIFKAMGKPEDIEFIEMPEYLKPKYQYYTKADTAKLMETGYIGELYTLEDAVGDYVKNYLATGKYLGDES